MIRRRVLVAIGLWLCAAVAHAHEVPDRVAINVFVKPENGRVVILVRMPANALIDFLLPTQSTGNWLDLEHADVTAEQGGRVWIADMLTVYEDGVAVPTPQLQAVRLSRVNDPAFRTFQDALSRINGPRLPADTLVVQEQVTVDAVLHAPIRSPHSSFSFTPRFGRLGVVVDTSVTFLPPDGGLRQFQYQGDPDTFALDPSAGETVRRFTREGFAHYFAATDYLLLALCGALAARRLRALERFAAALIGTQSLILIAGLAWLPNDPRLRGVFAVLIAATTVYAGIEAIVNERIDGVALGIAGGVAVGAFAWLALEPLVQFGGTYRATAGAGFTAGLGLAQGAAVGAFAIAAAGVHRLATAPRAATAIAAAFAIHIAWRRILERADALSLMMRTAPPINPGPLVVLGVAAIAVLTVFAYRSTRARVRT